MVTLEPIPIELLQSAPLNSWVAVSADLKRIIATGSTLKEVSEQADALGEANVVMARTPPRWGMFVL
jgi:hypothetical protein